MDLEALARVGTALADDTRRRLLVALLDGPAYPSELAARLGLTRPNVSNHLGCLKGCGLVVADAEGRRVAYRLSDPRLAHALQDLCALALTPEPGHPVPAPPAAVAAAGPTLGSLGDARGGSTTAPVAAPRPPGPAGDPEPVGSR